MSHDAMRSSMESRSIPNKDGLPDLAEVVAIRPRYEGKIPACWWPQVLITKGPTDKASGQGPTIWMSTPRSRTHTIQVEDQLELVSCRSSRARMMKLKKLHLYQFQAIPSTTTSFYASTLISAYLEWGQSDSQGLMTNGNYQQIEAC